MPALKLSVIGVLILSAILFGGPVPRPATLGRVVDPSGSAIAGARVAAHSGDRLIAATPIRRANSPSRYQPTSTR